MAGTLLIPESYGISYAPDSAMAGFFPERFDMTAAPAASSLTSGFNMGQVGLGMSIVGALQGAIGSFYSAKAAKQNLEFQSQISALNARMAENQAQSILEAGQRQVGKLTMKAGQIKSAQQASMAANGISLGEGSAAEVVASTDLMKEVDALTINANTVRSAWAARMQSTNYANQSLLEGTTAKGVSPWSAGMSSLMTGAGTVASAWYRDRKQDAIARALGLD